MKFFRRSSMIPAVAVLVLAACKPQQPQGQKQHPAPQEQQGAPAAQKPPQQAGDETVQGALAKLGTAVAAAEDRAEAAAPVQEGTGAVGSALAAVTDYWTEKRPDLHAKYYVYLQSAGWCGPCNQEMPHVVEQYKMMREQGVEIIFLSCDHNREGAVEFMQKYGADLPCISFKSDQAKTLPGFDRQRSIPRATIVAQDGTVVAPANYGPYIMKNWQKLIQVPAAEQQGQPAQEEEKPAAPAPVAPALADFPEYWTDARPAADAAQYIYLYSASWCGPCNREMPHVVELYKELRARGVELVLVSCDQKKEDAVKFLQQYGAQMPCVPVKTVQAHPLPGHELPKAIPSATMVDAQGKVLVPLGSAPAVLARWQEFAAQPESK
ncbi:MAG: TlpA family protein disulfide reductase [Akkermansia sp.]|nr:TlpA family protein disulfide reductase [Akkermansia sp.]